MPWTPDLPNAYTLTVYAREAVSTAAYDVKSSMSFTVQPVPLRGVLLDVPSFSALLPGMPVLLKRDTARRRRLDAPVQLRGDESRLLAMAYAVHHRSEHHLPLDAFPARIMRGEGHRPRRANHLHDEGHLPGEGLLAAILAALADAAALGYPYGAQLIRWSPPAADVIAYIVYRGEYQDNAIVDYRQHSYGLPRRHAVPRSVASDGNG